MYLLSRRREKKGETVNKKIHFESLLFRLLQRAAIGRVSNLPIAPFGNFPKIIASDDKFHNHTHSTQSRSTRGVCFCIKVGSSNPDPYIPVHRRTTLLIHHFFLILGNLPCYRFFHRDSFLSILEMKWFVVGIAFFGWGLELDASPECWLLSRLGTKRWWGRWDPVRTSRTPVQNSVIARVFSSHLRRPWSFEKPIHRSAIISYVSAYSRTIYLPTCIVTGRLHPARSVRRSTFAYSKIIRINYSIISTQKIRRYTKN